jgi:death-on-curing family protein
MWIPAKNDVVEVHEHLTRLFEREADPISPPGVKSEGLLESACGRPHTSMGSHDKYPTIELKLAALFHSLTKNHPFHNGNKRTALATLLAALSRNDKRFSSNVNDNIIFDFVVAVTADNFPQEGNLLSVDQVVHEIAHWIKSNTDNITTHPSGMKVAEFSSRCAEAGATVKDSKGATVITTQHGSVRISRSTRRIDGPVVRRYLRNLGLNESKSGATIDDIQDGMSKDRHEIYRYIKAMRRLAKT